MTHFHHNLLRPTCTNVRSTFIAHLHSDVLVPVACLCPRDATGTTKERENVLERTRRFPRENGAISSYKRGDIPERTGRYPTSEAEKTAKIPSSFFLFY